MNNNDNKIKDTNEPSLEKIDDYNGTASKDKLKTINIIIVSLIVITIVLYILKVT